MIIMEKKIVLINGSGGVGKDTFIGFCSNYVRVLNVSTIDKVKQAAKILGWDGRKTEKDRLFLSNLKNLSGEYSDHSYNYIKNIIDEFTNEYVRSLYAGKWPSILFIHVREPKEIERLVKDFGCTTLLIKNKNVSQISSNMADSNVENYKYDYIINNDGYLIEFEIKAQNFIYLLTTNHKQEQQIL
jgi:CO dehydrogenase nickel-insertion accessory protein CooC1